MSNQLIAQVTGLATDTLTRIRRRWNEQGMASLQDAPRPGRPPKVSPAYRQELREALRRGPLEGALDLHADYELWYQDESEFHLHPHLTRAWMP